MDKTLISAGIQPDKILVSSCASRALDEEAQADWGFNVFALVEAAGRLCSQQLIKAFPGLFGAGSGGRPRVTVAAGTGNNGADAMVMLRHWIITGLVEPASSTVVLNRMPPASRNNSPHAALIKSFRKMNVPVVLWDGDIGEAAGRLADHVLAQSDIIVDGIVGTGLDGAIRGTPLEMLQAINSHDKPFIVSIDIPSGNSDNWEPGMPIIQADLTLAIEPRKLCLYSPAARPYAGIIIPVDGVFPNAIITRHMEAELLDWNSARERVLKIRPDAYKNKRGTVEIRAGSPGTTGAALIAARGAQAAGAGLIRLVVDDDIYPILASQVGGILVFPAGISGTDDSANFNADAILLGPGWGKTQNRLPVFEQALELENKGVPLILDAEAIELARDKVFNGNAILTPHPGELSKFLGVQKEKLLCNPGPMLLKLARERKAVIIFKGHVITVASPDGRLGVVDGMRAVLAAGGSGDLLAGLCAAIAARMIQEERPFDGYTCAAVASALFIELGNPERFENRFTDPLELANRAAVLAGEIWLSADLPGFWRNPGNIEGPLS